MMQARVARTIKHARCLGLFSYKGSRFRINNPMVRPQYDRGPARGSEEDEESLTQEPGMETLPVQNIDYYERDEQAKHSWRKKSRKKEEGSEVEVEEEE